MPVLKELLIGALQRMRWFHSLPNCKSSSLGAKRLWPQPGVMVITLSKGGAPGSTRIYTVAPDGRTMVETATYFGQDGLPVMRTNYFIRTK